MSIKANSLNSGDISNLSRLDRALETQNCQQVAHMQKIRDLLHIGDNSEVSCRVLIPIVVSRECESLHNAIAQTWRSRAELAATVLHSAGYSTDRHNPDSYRNPNKPGVEFFFMRNLNVIELLVSDIARERCTFGVEGVLRLLNTI
jgi:hypothetical protein